jgi:HEAT repeat protein
MCGAAFDKLLYGCLIMVVPHLLQLHALTRLANRGDEGAVGPVIKILQRIQGHERGDLFAPDMTRVNKHAVKALGFIAGRGDEEALKALHIRILDDQEPAVREAAARSLGNLASADDSRSLSALMLCVADQDEGVRRTALKSVKSILRRQREVHHDGQASCAAGCAEDVPDNLPMTSTQEESECGASRLWLLPGVWGG